MNKAKVYQKTARGVEAISQRLYGLVPKQRSMLIMIDGKRKFEELSRLSAMLGDTEHLMAELETGGFIEPVSGAVASEPVVPTAAAAKPAAPAETATPAGITEKALPQAKRLAVRLLTDALGPMAEDMCLRIEAARNAGEFNATAAKAHVVLRQTAGAAAANRFATELAAL
jgi:hypothetical protein